MTIASASEFMISSDGMPFFTRLTMSVSANTPHLAATWCSFESSKPILTTSSFGRPTLMTHLSMVAPVPDAHLSFIEVMAVLPPVSSFFLKMMILASWPPSSHDRADVGVQRLDRQGDRVHLLHELRRRCAAPIGAPPEPVMKVRICSFGEVRERRGDALQEGEHELRLLGLVAQVVAPEDLLGDRVDDDRLHGRRADVDADRDCFSPRIHRRRLCSHACSFEGKTDTSVKN